jgi:hypothetical protein
LQVASSTMQHNQLKRCQALKHISAVIVAAAGHSLAMSAWGGLSPFMISAIVMLVQPSALAAGLLLVVTGLVSWGAAVPLNSLMPHINARGVRPAPHLSAVADPLKHLAELKGARHRKKAAQAAAEAATAGAESVMRASSEDS